MTKRRRDNDRKQPQRAGQAQQPAGPTEAPQAAAGPTWNQRLTRILPWFFIGLSCLFLVAKAVPPSGQINGMNVHEFGKLPLVYQGRIKPFDTLARNSLMIISDRQTFIDSTTGKEEPAIKWLLDAMTDRPTAMQHKVFRIENAQILDMLGLEERKEPRFRYAMAEFVTDENLKTIDDHARRAQQREAGQRDVYDTKLLELRRQMHLFQRIAGAHETIDVARMDSREKLMSVLQHYRRLMEGGNLPHAVPPTKPAMKQSAQAKREELPESARAEMGPIDVDELSASDHKDAWQPLMIAHLRDVAHIAQDQQGDRNKAVQYLVQILNAYQRGDAETFNSEVAGYRQWLTDRMPQTMQATGVETVFHNFAPFLQSAALYVLVFVLGCVGFLGFARPLHRSAFWIMVLALVIHTVALIVRMWLQGRPPVTNLYSSAIFIGWGAVVFGLIIEMIYRVGLGSVVASIVGFGSLIVAHNLSGDGDTMEMMQAVLDTNFWLATHVTVVTLGYSATFLAGVLGIVFVLTGVLTRSLTPGYVKDLGRMIYGVICFALLLSFTGTVLGGIWADQSWGRFWGWDPKENGALIIVIWNALILHARWGGMVQQRGVATLAIFGNVVTAWSWFGTNMLGVGLHSYGFMDSAVFWLMLFVVSQLLLIAMGSLPLTMWRSFNPDSAKRPSPGLQTRTGPDPGLAK